MKAFTLMVLVSSAAYAGSVADVRAQVPRMDMLKRGPLASSIRPALETLGRDAVTDLIAAATEPRDPSWTESAVLAWRVSVLEALGTLRDPRARQVFERSLGDDTGHFLVQRAAAEGLAQLGDFALLRSFIGRDAVVAGIGALRRPEVAQLLRAELAKQPSAARAKLLVKALGDVGNAWAWKTLPDRELEQATRNAAAEALVEAFTGHDGEVRQAAAKALLMVDALATPALIAQAKASGHRVAELEDLQLRLLRNPVR